MSWICPYTENCIVYQEFARVRGKQRDIIVNGSKGYSCLAHSAFDDPTTEGGIIIPTSMQNDFKDPNIKGGNNMGETECSHITLLNLLVKLR